MNAFVYSFNMCIFFRCEHGSVSEDEFESTISKEYEKNSKLLDELQSLRDEFEGDKSKACLFYTIHYVLEDIA